MPEQFHAKDLVDNPNRRSYLRQQVRSLSYIDLGDGNGGIVLNLSEGGLALQAVTSLMDDQLPRLRFQLSEARNWLEASGRVTWTSESRKVAGIEFVNLSDAARKQIKEWISLGDSPIQSQAAQIAAPAEKPPSSAADSLLFMPVPGRSTGIAPARDNSPAVFSSSTMFTDAPSTASVQPAAPANLKNSWTLSPPQPEPRRRLVALFGFLAVVSLIVGWAAGHAGLARIFNFANAARASVNQNSSPVAARTPASEPKASEIEIQGADNRTRLIPFNGPLPSEAANQHGTGQHQAAEKNPFQVWMPSPPIRPQGAGSTAQAEIPPILTNVPANSTNVLPSPADSGSRNSSVAAPPPSQPQAPARVGELQRGRLIRRVEPLYPTNALESGIEGTVKLHAVIGVDGAVKTLESVSGPDLLIDSAMNAVHQWRYSPTLLDGKPIETDQDIFIVFRLPVR